MACWSSEGESGERKTANAGYGRPAEEATAARKHAEMEGLACDTALRGRWRMRTQAGKDAACNGATGGGVGGSGEEAGTQPADSKKEVSTEPTMDKKGEMHDEKKIRGRNRKDKSRSDEQRRTEGKEEAAEGKMKIETDGKKNGRAVANTTSSTLAAPNTNHPFLTALQCKNESARFPPGDPARPVPEVQTTVASAPPLEERGSQSQPQLAPQALEKGQVGVPGWSTEDGLLDAFLKETVDTENLLKLETMPVTRRIAVARLLQLRIAQVRDATAYIGKVISTASAGYT